MTLDCNSNLPQLARARALCCVVLFCVFSGFAPALLAEDAKSPKETDALEQVKAAEQSEFRVDTDLTLEMETISKDLLELRRDLVVLEENMLFPASSQLAVFVGVDAGTLFRIDAVTLKINGKRVTHHLYTEKQVDALSRGGVQKLFVGNIDQGKNTVTAFFTGRGPTGRDYRRASTVTFEKTFEPAFVELKVTDSQEKYQADFTATAGSSSGQ